jgi:uncharacterized membrane protein YqjE
MPVEAQDTASTRGGGLFDSVKVLAGTMVAIVHTRLELLSTDLEEERVWLISMLVWTLVALFCAGLGIVLAILFVVVALWDSHRLLALGIPTILLFLGAALSWKVVAGKAKAKPRLFASSIAELSKDREQLPPRS